MISLSDAINTVDLNKYYAILNDYAKNLIDYKKSKFVDRNFYYNSGNNPKFLNISEIKNLISSELK